MGIPAVAFIDARATQGLAGLEGYFRLARKVPLPGNRDHLYIEKVVPVTDMSLAELARLMRRYVKPGWGVLVYCHGEPTGLQFPVDAASDTNEVTSADLARASYQADLVERDPTGSGIGLRDPYIAQRYAGAIDGAISSADSLRLHTEAGRRFVTDLIAIRTLRIPHLAIWAGRVGQNAELMKFAALMVGAKSVSAPKLRTAAITARLAVPANVIAGAVSASKAGAPRVAHQFEYPNPMSAYFREAPEKLRLAFRRRPLGPARFAITDVVATNPAVVQEFLWNTAGFDATATEADLDDSTPLHGLDDGDQRIIFPREREYLANMACFAV